MITSYELSNLGKNIAKDYVTNNSSITEGIVKVAKDRGLSQQQISRITESANNETYLQLMKTSSDKYLDYPVGNADEAYEAVTGITKESSLKASADHYSEPVPLITDLELYPGLEKTAEVVPINQGVLRQEVERLNGNISFLNNSLSEASLNFEGSIEGLKKQAEQLVLGGTSYNDISNIMKVAMPWLNKPIDMMVKDELSTKIPHVDFEKDAEHATTPDTDSDIFKQSEKVLDSFKKFATISNTVEHFQDKCEEIIQDSTQKSLVKESAWAPTTFVGKLGKELLEFAKRHKVLATLGVSAPAAFAAGKEVGKQEQKVLLNRAIAELAIPQTRRRVSP
jgi:hypothetical protein